MRLLRKLRELFAGLYSAITIRRWNPYARHSEPTLDELIERRRSCPACSIHHDSCLGHRAKLRVVK